LHIRINPQNEAAKKGLERLEKQMKVCALWKESYVLLSISVCFNSCLIAIDLPTYCAEISDFWLNIV